MSRAAQKLIAASGGKAYEIEQSLMFDRGDGAYLIRDDGVIADGNKRTFTFSTWFKKVQVGTNDVLFSARNGGGNVMWMIYIPGSEETFWIFQRDSSGNVMWYLEPTQKIRDIGAWYHFVIASDTTQSTASDRVKLYINGTQITSFTGSSSYPDQNSDTPVNDDSYDHQIGYNNAGSLDGYMAETYLIDGTAQAPSAFGETDEDTGAWIPKKYTGSYGNNGFYLKYKSGAIGTDSSGNGNNYTANNVGNGDILLDTPTNNFPLVNTIEPYNTTISTFRQGTLNIKATAYSSGNYGNHYTTFILPSSGKWYVEMLTGVQAGSGNVAQLAISSQNPTVGGIIPTQDQLWTTFSSTTGLNIDTYGNTADLYDGGSSVDQDTGLTATSYVTALAIDIDNDKVWVGYDGGSSITWLNSGNPASGSNGAAHTFTSDSSIYTSVATSSDNANRSYVIMNFGQNGTFSNYKTAGGNTDGNGVGDFFYSPPSGFKALCSKNLPTPTIKLPAEHFNTVLYTGNGSTQSITGAGFQPDLVWIKNREQYDDHKLTDAIRGVTKELESNTTAVEATNADGLTAFGADGFSLGDDVEYNTNTETYASWNWKANGAGSSNSEGSVTVTTSANATAGFSMIYHASEGYFGGTYGHGLGKKPALIITRDVDNVNNWYVWHHSFTNPDYQYLSGLNSYPAVATSSANEYSVGSTTVITDQGLNRKGITYVWAEIEGFSKIGSYTGNGSANGPYINTGFRPAWVLVKSAASGTAWFLWDNKRDSYNPVGRHSMWASDVNGDTDDSSYYVDFLSNGFKLRGTNAGSNNSGTQIFYMAFSEFPFKYANAR